jgi:type VI secretion system secreted protein VgrG
MSDIRYSFSSQGSTDLLEVIRFKGHDAISSPYEYTLELKSKSADIESEAILSSICTFTTTVGQHTVPVHGILSQFEQCHQISDYTVYKATLVPRIWQLSLYYLNQVYLDMGIEKIIQTVMEEGGIPTADYQIKLDGTYPIWPYRCQYGETHLQYLHRMLEHLGIYYYFEQGKSHEKVVFCDHSQFQPSVPEPEIAYAPPTSLTSTDDNIHSWVYRRDRMPKKVVLKDYNYDSPSLKVEGEAEVDPKGTGNVYIYGEHFDSPEEGKLLAKVRAAEIKTAKVQCHGESHINRLRPGYFFTLKDHFRSSFNQEYLVVSINHEGVAGSHMTAASGLKPYANSFTAIPSAHQYRPPRITPKPKFFGTIHATIDAEQDGTHAEVDSKGRYKVLMPFDRATRNAGKASHWFRLMTPFGGENEGMHFSLRKGTEVLMTFYNGDPDRPTISGSVPNATHPSIIHSSNQSRSTIKTSSGNMIDMEDKEDTSRIKLYSPKKGTYMHLGASDAAGHGLVMLTKGVHRLESAGGEQVTIRANDSGFPEATTYQATADPVKWTSEDQIERQILNAQAVFAFPVGDDNGISKTARISKADEEAGKYLIERRLGHRYHYLEGNEYHFGGGNVFGFGGGLTVATINEAADGYAVETTEVTNMESIAKTIPGVVADKIFVEHTDGPTIAWASDRSHAFNFGGGSEYNFGGGWVETFIDGGYDSASAPSKMNQKFSDKDIASPGAESIKGKDVDLGGAFDVEKTIGNAYAYSEGKSIEIAYNSDTEEQVYGGKSYSYTYSKGGTPVSYEFTDNDSGDYEEKTFDASAGALVALTKGNSRGGGTAEFNFAFSNDVNLDITFGTALSTEIKGAVAIETSIFGGAHIETNIHAGTYGEIKMTAGPHVEASLLPLKIEIDNEQFSLKAIAAAIFKGIAPVKIESPPPVTIEQVTTLISAKGVELSNKMADIAQKTVEVHVKQALQS